MRIWRVREHVHPSAELVVLSTALARSKEREPERFQSNDGAGRGVKKQILPVPGFPPHMGGNSPPFPPRHFFWGGSFPLRIWGVKNRSSNSDQYALVPPLISKSHDQNTSNYALFGLFPTGFEKKFAAGAANPSISTSFFWGGSFPPRTKPEIRALQFIPVGSGYVLVTLMTRFVRENTILVDTPSLRFFVCWEPCLTFRPSSLNRNCKRDIFIRL